MANATGTPQGALYAARGAGSPAPDGNMNRNRSAEQQYSAASGNPYNFKRGNGMNYAQFLNGQDPSLSRYVPSTLRSTDPSMGTSWNNNPGGYAYNLPTSFGGFGGFSQFSRQPQAQMQRAPTGAMGFSRGAPSFSSQAGPAREYAPPAANAGVDPSLGQQQQSPARSALSYEQLMKILSMNQPPPNANIDPVGSYM